MSQLLGLGTGPSFWPTATSLPCSLTNFRNLHRFVTHLSARSLSRNSTAPVAKQGYSQKSTMKGAFSLDAPTIQDADIRCLTRVFFQTPHALSAEAFWQSEKEVTGTGSLVVQTIPIATIRNDTERICKFASLHRAIYRTGTANATPVLYLSRVRLARCEIFADSSLLGGLFYVLGSLFIISVTIVFDCLWCATRCLLGTDKHALLFLLPTCVHRRRCGHRIRKNKDFFSFHSRKLPFFGQNSQGNPFYLFTLYFFTLL